MTSRYDDDNRMSVNRKKWQTPVNHMVSCSDASLPCGASPQLETHHITATHTLNGDKVLIYNIHSLVFNCIIFSNEKSIKLLGCFLNLAILPSQKESQYQDCFAIDCWFLLYKVNSTRSRLFCNWSQISGNYETIRKQVLFFIYF